MKVYLIIHSGWSLAWIFMKERVKIPYLDLLLHYLDLRVYDRFRLSCTSDHFIWNLLKNSWSCINLIWNDYEPVISGWRFAGEPMIAQHWWHLWYFRGSGPVVLRNPIIVLWFCRGGGVPDPLPLHPLDLRLRFLWSIATKLDTSQMCTWRSLTSYMYVWLNI